jgi:hypothetical protein
VARLNRVVAVDLDFVVVLGGGGRGSEENEQKEATECRKWPKSEKEAGHVRKWNEGKGINFAGGDVKKGGAGR